jgi:hypothetical protein
MPPASAGSSMPANLTRIASRPLALVRALLFERRYFFHLVGLLVLGELVLGLLIIAKIPCESPLGSSRLELLRLAAPKIGCAPCWRRV